MSLTDIQRQSLETLLLPILQARRPRAVIRFNWDAPTVKRDAVLDGAATAADDDRIEDAA